MAAVAWWCSPIPTTVAIGLSTVLSIYSFFGPTHGFALPDLADQIQVRFYRSVTTAHPCFDGSGGNDPNQSGGGRNADADFHGQKRGNDTHASLTDPDARLARKGGGKESKLCYAGHLLIENRNGLVVGTLVNEATGNAERDAADALVSDIAGSHRITVGADKGYDRRDMLERMRLMKATLHAARKRRFSAMNGRITRHPGYAISQVVRKRVEEPFGWDKVVGGLRKLRHRGVALVDS